MREQSRKRLCFGVFNFQQKCFLQTHHDGSWVELVLLPFGCCQHLYKNALPTAKGLRCAIAFCTMPSLARIIGALSIQWKIKVFIVYMVGKHVTGQFTAGNQSGCNFSVSPMICQFFSGYQVAFCDNVSGVLMIIIPHFIFFLCPHHCTNLWFICIVSYAWLFLVFL